MEQIEKQVKREGTTIYINSDLLKAVKSFVYLKKAKGEKISITEFFEEAVREKLRKEGMEVE